MMEEILIRLALDIGERMLHFGGEVNRVEDTIERILHAYGFGRVDVFTITSEIQVTAVGENGKIYSQFRRIHKWGTNLGKLEELNQLSRYICSNRPACSEIQKSLTDIDKEEENNRRGTGLSYVGAVLAASGFTIFGGNLYDAAATAPLACMITFMDHHSDFKSENQLLYYFFFAIATGLVGNLLVRIGYGAGILLNLDKMLIGCIMLTIPGIAITYSVRDMLLGETITGLFRFVESLLIAASIASGYIISSMLIGGVL